MIILFVNYFVYVYNHVLSSCFYYHVLLLLREALDKAEKATERLATVSKDVIKALEIANPKETKK